MKVEGSDGYMVNGGTSNGSQKQTNKKKRKKTSASISISTTTTTSSVNQRKKYKSSPSRQAVIKGKIIGIKL